MTLAACGGGHGSSLPATQSAAQTPADAMRGAQSVAARISIPHPAGELAFADGGRRDPNAPVSIAVTLRYNDQAALDQFVADVNDPHSPNFRRFLSNAEFDARFSPTPAQEQTVIDGLQKAGFTITGRFANRAMVDATAPSAKVEKYFATEMHTVQQGRHGERFTNTTAATVPAEIAGVVASVSLSNLVIARTKAEAAVDAIATPGRTRVPNAYDVSAAARRGTSGIQPDAGNILSDPGFESGGFTYWPQCGNVAASILTANPHTGSYSERSGTPTSEPAGDAGVCQKVTIPASGVLTFWVWQGTNETSTAYSYQEADLLNSAGAVVRNFYTTVSNAQTWVQKSYDVSAYAGQTLYVYFGVHGDGTAGMIDRQYVDDVSLSSGATPTPAPTATPAPTPAPTATPIASGSCTGAALNGPLSNSYGTLATGIAKSFDFPVQHGCNGAGQTAAIVIDKPVNTTYLNQYLSAAGVTQTGTVTNTAVDGGGTGDSAETDLDVQTIAGLAPAANIIVYHIGSLTDQAIEDAYNTAVSANTASAVNSSFGGCEAANPTFESATNSIAQQGAAKGITFAASSGDTGSNGCTSSTGTPTKGVSAPAGGPYFTSVGGVNFTLSSTTVSSVTAGAASGDSSGGGVSTVVALPSWQSGLAGVITSGRNQPDISLPFDPVAVYTATGPGQYLGTSWSSPQIVALIIERNQLRGNRAGWINQSLYTLFKNNGYGTYFIPCTSGSNGAYSCSSQYNQVAGVGSPKAYVFAGAL